MRFASTSLIFAAVLAVLARPADGGLPAVKRLSFAKLVPDAAAFRDSVLRAAAPVVRRPAGTGGVYTTADGYHVTINVSASYKPDRVAPQSIADFLDSLLHGHELGDVTVDVGTLPETRVVCGSAALACYDPDTESIYVPGEDPNGVALEQILAHEYGHHVAENRANPPWSALAYGPKLWASGENICRRALAGEVYPGAENSYYRLNPGEGWAETYRLLNASRAGTWRTMGWNLVDPIFYPSSTALPAAEADVLRPWTSTTVTTVHGALHRHGYRHWTLHPRLDGTATVSVQGNAQAGFFGTGPGLLADQIRPTVPICGERVLQLALRGTGQFTLTYAVP